MKKLVIICIFLSSCVYMPEKSACPYPNADYCSKRGNLMYLQNARASAKPSFLRSSNKIRITRPKFKKIGKKDGQWSGYLNGNGFTKLYLQILDRGKIQSTKYIGSIKIQKGEPAVPFHFRSQLPKLRSWSWKVVAL